MYYAIIVFKYLMLMITASALRKRQQRINDKITGKHQINKEKNCAYNKSKYRIKRNRPSTVEVPYLYPKQARTRCSEVEAVHDSSPIAQDAVQVAGESSPIAQDAESSPIAQDAIQVVDDNIKFNNEQYSRYLLRGKKNQAMNGMLLDQWPINFNEETSTRTRSRPTRTRSIPQQHIHFQQLVGGKRCCACDDKCANTCPCAASRASCYSCNSPCFGNPFGNNFFVDAPWLYTFDTDGKGKGVKSKVDLYPFNLLVRYEGKRCSDPKAIKKVYSREGPQYAFDVNPTTIIDGLHGGIAKYINHSCDPNLRAVKWVERKVGRKGKLELTDQICFHVLKCIKGHKDELTLDYQMGDNEDSGRKCLCGSKKCKQTY